jgi:hypothetical protein
MCGLRCHRWHRKSKAAAASAAGSSATFPSRTLATVSMWTSLLPEFTEANTTKPFAAAATPSASGALNALSPMAPQRTRSCAFTCGQRSQVTILPSAMATQSPRCCGLILSQRRTHRTFTEACSAPRSCSTTCGRRSQSPRSGTCNVIAAAITGGKCKLTHGCGLAFGQRTNAPHSCCSPSLACGLRRSHTKSPPLRPHLRSVQMIRPSNTRNAVDVDLYFFDSSAAPLPLPRPPHASSRSRATPTRAAPREGRPNRGTHACGSVPSLSPSHFSFPLASFPHPATSPRERCRCGLCQIIQATTFADPLQRCRCECPTKNLPDRRRSTRRAGLFPVGSHARLPTQGNVQHPRPAKAKDSAQAFSARQSQKHLCQRLRPAKAKDASTRARTFGNGRPPLCRNWATRGPKGARPLQHSFAARLSVAETAPPGNIFGPPKPKTPPTLGYPVEG